MTTRWRLHLGPDELNEILMGAFATDGRKVDLVREVTPGRVSLDVVHPITLNERPTSANDFAPDAGPELPAAGGG
jgi:hypothetical protein